MKTLLIATIATLLVASPAFANNHVRNALSNNGKTPQTFNPTSPDKLGARAGEVPALGAGQGVNRDLVPGLNKPSGQGSATGIGR